MFYVGVLFCQFIHLKSVSITTGGILRFSFSNEKVSFSSSRRLTFRSSSKLSSSCAKSDPAVGGKIEASYII